MLTNAFNSLLNLNSRVMVLTRPGVAGTYSIKVSVSNYQRNVAAPEEMIVYGREFVISLQTLTESGWSGKVKRGDWITDTEFGKMSIVEVEEMVGLGGILMGYRVRMG